MQEKLRIVLPFLFIFETEYLLLWRILAYLHMMSNLFIMSQKQLKGT